MKPAPLTEAELSQLPVAVGRDTVMRAFQIGHERYNQLRREGTFDCFLLIPPMSAHKRYSGALLRAYLRGEVADIDRGLRRPRLRRAS